MPVEFRSKRRPFTPGIWEPYLPGPLHAIPWGISNDRLTGVDALLPGEIYTMGTGLHLATPLGDG